MSAWGRQNNAIIIANVLFTQGSTLVTNAHANVQTSSAFSFESNTFGNVDLSPTGGIMPGDYIVVPRGLSVDAGTYTQDSPKLQVKTVDSSNAITLTDASPFTANVVHPGVQQGPKYVANIASGTATVLRGNIGSPPGTRNVYSIQRVVGVTSRQANIEHNKKVFGINHSGWVHRTEYKNADGETRQKTEVLAVQSKNGIVSNFNYPHDVHTFHVSFGTPGDGDPNTRQPTESPPSFLSNVAGANVHLFANAMSHPDGANIEYKWLSKPSNAHANTAFVDVQTPSGAAGMSLTAPGNILFIANVSDVDGQVFMCHAFTQNEFGIKGLANSLHAEVKLTS